MIRILLMALRSIFILPYWIVMIFRLSKADKYPVNTRYDFIRRIVPVINRRGLITLECYGTHNLPKENGYVMFPNHQGLFDTLAFFETHERPFTTVMKKELKDVFVLKQIVRLLQAEIIDRDDIKQSMQVIMSMTKRVKSGENFIIFAEGTRSRKGNQILEFKAGSFKSAMNAKSPIVPVALINSFLVFDSKSIKPVTVQIHYLPPLYYEDYQGMKSVEIAEKVSMMIQETLDLYSNSTNHQS